MERLGFIQGPPGANLNRTAPRSPKGPGLGIAAALVYESGPEPVVPQNKPGI